MAPAAPVNEPQWPPRSPHEALVSTPGGRQRYRQMLDQTPPSPSPSRKTRNLPSVNLLAEMDQDDDDDDEDEETLQLKLQEIQARLKLKKLQSAKSRKAAEDGVDKLDATTSELAISGNARSRSARGIAPGESDEQRAPLKPQVEVPASPVRKLQPSLPPTSPSRVLLGIDKGLRARDISLKRAPSYRDSQVGGDAIQPSGYLRRSRTTSNVTTSSEASRLLSFNERLAAVRTEDSSRAERQKKIQGLRSNAFGIDQEEMDGYKKNAVDIPDEPLRPPVYSREEIMSQAKPARPTSGGLQRSNTVPSIRSISDTNSSTTINNETSEQVPQDISEQEATAFEPYSSFHLSKRILPHRVLARHVSGKKAFNIKDLLKVVKSPDYALPDIEQDIVIFAILAKKSEPRAHKPTKNGGKEEDRGKYMVMTLVDLEYELDLFLFNTGFTRFWKLTEGTVVAILNPNIMRPPPGREDTGRFSLVINSDEDTIVEIGKARDLGFCQSVKKDGDACGSWVNVKRTHYCEFHSNEAVRKQRGSRMEVNGGGFGSKQSQSRQGSSGNKQPQDNQSGKAKNYDWESRTQWFVSRSMSAADLIDGKDRGASDRKDRAEFLKRDLEAKERERDMMNKLGKIGNAAGKEYMRYAGSRAANGHGSGVSSSQASSSQASPNENRKPDAKSLGLLTKGSNIHLSPVKRKRPESSQAGSLASSGRSALGWGSSLKEKLSKMKEGEKLRKEELPPLRKKTRFVTDKGIREAGRESLGADLMERRVTLDDDDDELVIVK
ncbi:hypothetical protein B0J13DRAFT_250053 [Dactylonectria estremocensis]|uniref:Zinc finger Mcm10/DnaG-type domain-containing protein n=1 Tax=Dactylonectria estremocensis TaxID=1079267 RepID=A0A9P9JAT6_9HYPO|nr:hypothetical protein B0J13DRAFT_250053 [Dactylonectria estremocensis]